MLIEVSNIVLPLDAGLPDGHNLVRQVLAHSLGVDEHEVADVQLVKRSLDARKKSDVHFVATLAVRLVHEAQEKRLLDAFSSGTSGVRIRPYEGPLPLEIPQLAHLVDATEDLRPVVVGMGPAGLFCALYLAEAGLRPLVIERGGSVEERAAAVEAFETGGALDLNTNVQFGEGGAGTFSDGKLTTGTKSAQVRHVLQTFVEAGAPEEILWQAKPHIGTDRLPDVVRALRQQIVAAGGEVRFHTQLVGLHFEEGQLTAIDARTVHVAGDACTKDAVERVSARRVVLACGHSARDTFQLLRDAGVELERKPFSVGVRIEHPQTLINQTQYGKAASHPALGAADYQLAVHLPDGRGVYTFCMCPGGSVVAAASEEGGVCVNGMSNFARDGENANSALLVDVRPDDLEGDDVLAGVDLQQRMERAAFKVAQESHPHSTYHAPAQTVGDFLEGRSGTPSVLVSPTYPRGVVWCDLHSCLPEFVSCALAQALPLLDRKLKGFAHPEAVLTGAETRSSSPVRVLRSKQFQASLPDEVKKAASASAQGSTSSAPSSATAPGPTSDPVATSNPVAISNHVATSNPAFTLDFPSLPADVSGDTPKNSPAQESGLYPCGEGAGYAGGIMSAAVDGLRVAEAIVQQMAKGSLIDR